MSSRKSPIKKVNQANIGTPLPPITAHTHLQSHINRARERYKRLQQRIKLYRNMSSSEKKRFQSHLAKRPRRIIRYRSINVHVPKSKQITFYTTLIKYYKLQLNDKNKSTIQPYLDQAIKQLDTLQHAR